MKVKGEFDLSCVKGIQEYVKAPQCVQRLKNHALVFLRTERKVRIALRAIRNQIALDWTGDEIIGEKQQIHRFVKKKV